MVVCIVYPSLWFTRYCKIRQDSDDFSTFRAETVKDLRTALTTDQQVRGSTPLGCTSFSRKKTFTKWLLRVDIAFFDSNLFEPLYQRTRGVRLNSWLNKTIICWICWWTSVS